MKRILIVILVAWLFVRSGGIDSLFTLFFAGVIPGTDVVIPASFMLTVYIAVGVLLAHHFIFLNFNPAPKPIPKTKAKTKTKAKRTTNRYSKAKA